MGWLACKEACLGRHNDWRTDSQLTHRFAHKPGPINPDVIIVGAGVAGLSAAERLRTSGFDVIVLESADHTGGRCVTDNQIFSTPFDLGASWLHCTDVNPLADIAEG